MNNKTLTARMLPFAAAVAILSWASAYPVVRIALRDMPPVPLAAIRYAVAAVLAAVWLACRRVPPPAWRDVPRVLACAGIGISLYNVLFNIGEVTVSAGAASLLISSSPLLTALIAMPVLGERLTGWGWAGSVLSFSGVILIAGSQSGGIAFGSGATMLLAAALCAAIYTIMLRQLMPRYGALPTIAYILMAGALLLVPWLPRACVVVAHAPWSCTAAVIELGLFPAALGYGAWTFVISHMGAARGSALLYALPPATILLAFALTGEVPAARTLLGGGVVMLGVVIMNTWGHPARRQPSRG
ncbi:DMT family transporter [Komagataeibacter sucrofermentans]|uniref:EamA family transporter n=1 Tax=Komagataeibacter sucrofermentans TaxID=1053551 RepID=A0A318QGN0_9PROT|nr:DMT family transporter [Komagataeibacter sucrofermentans]PYD77730.1 EamA family transporter [Komagataeibacter sucrofermentans]